jgi:hypothetical protein
MANEHTVFLENQGPKVQVKSPRGGPSVHGSEEGKGGRCAACPG